jgi:hypothetical protein
MEEIIKMKDAIYLLEADGKVTRFTGPILEDEWSDNVSEYSRKLKNALRRITGYSAFFYGILTEDRDRVEGHYGQASWGGGLHPIGKFVVKKVS